ncbi:MAG: glycosyl hydrolase family 28 protein [Brevinematia bacterium]
MFRFLKVALVSVTLMFIWGCSTTPSSSSSGSSGGGDTGGTAWYYKVKVNGVDIPVTRISKFDIPVNYVRLDYSTSGCAIEVEVNGDFSTFNLGPKSKNINPTKSGSKLSFNLTEPAYLVLQIPDKEKLFIFVDPEEINPPQLGDPNVVNIMSYSGVDNTGKTVITSILQNAIDDTAKQGKILYFPAGIYSTKALIISNSASIYLAQGAVLNCSNKAGDLISHPSQFTKIEWCSRGFIHFYNATNARIFGRGIIDGNGKIIAANKMFNIKMENSANILVEGILSIDSRFWNTMPYRSSNVVISNYKVINNRLKDEWNETDGVDFNNCVDSLLYNAFLYTGDDSMAVKSDDAAAENMDLITNAGYSYEDPTPNTLPYMNVSNIVHKKIVAFGHGACKVGTKTYGIYMSDIVYEDIDVLGGMRGLVVDGVDTALVKGVKFKNIRIEYLTGRQVDLNINVKDIFWRTAVGMCTISNIIMEDIYSDMTTELRIIGEDHLWLTNTHPFYGQQKLVTDVLFKNYFILGNKLTSFASATFTTNTNISNIRFE